MPTFLSRYSFESSQTTQGFLPCHIHEPPWMIEVYKRKNMVNNVISSATYNYWCHDWNDQPCNYGQSHCDNSNVASVTQWYED